MTDAAVNAHGDDAHRRSVNHFTVRAGAFLLALCAWSPASPAQDSAPAPQRQKVLGRVVALDGKPWAGATVELIGSSYPTYWNTGTPDEMRVQSDASGSFAAVILPYRHYSVWAWGPAADGGFRLTRVAEDAVPLTEVRLVERPLPQAPVRLRLEDQGGGVRPWGPLSFQLMVRPHNVVVRPVVFDAHLEAAVPALPQTYAMLEAVTQQGVRVWAVGIPLVQALRVGKYERSAQRGVPLPSELDPNDPAVTVVRLPKPTDMRFTVRARGGKPIPEATILVGAQSSMGSINDVYDCRPLARTDASGQVTVPMYLTWLADGNLAWPSPDVLVRAEGHGAKLCRMMDDLVDGDERPTHDSAAGLAELEPEGHAVAGQLLWGPGKPAASVPVLLYASNQMGATKPFVGSTDTEGRFRIAGLGPRSTYRVSALVPVSEATQREECYLAFSPPCTPANGVHDLGAIELGELRAVQCQVVAKDGAPVDRGRVYVGEPDAMRPNTPLTFVTDKLGRCTVRARSGASLAVFAAHEEGFAIEKVEVGEEKAPIRVRLQLAAAAWLAGRVMDKEGKPLERAQIHVRGAVVRQGSEWYASFLDGIASTTDYRMVLTDAVGRFRVPCTHTGVTLQISAWLRGDDGSYWERSGAELVVDLETPAPDVEIVLERKR